jgi:DNA-binding Xre family transcriptional regulator
MFTNEFKSSIIITKGGENMKTKKLLKVMVDKEISKSKLGELTGVTLQQIGRIVNGKSSGSLSWWRKAAEVLQVEVAEIIED